MIAVERGLDTYTVDVEERLQARYLRAHRVQFRGHEQDLVAYGVLRDHASVPVVDGTARSAYDDRAHTVLACA